MYRFPWEALERSRAEKSTAVQPALIQLFFPCKSRGLYQHVTVSTRIKGILLKVLWNSKSLGARTECADSDIFFAQSCHVFRFSWILLFLSYKLCLAEVEDFMRLPRIPWYPAARLGVAIAELLAILDLSHTQGSTLQAHRWPWSLSLLCAFTIIPVSAITLHVRINCTEHTDWMFLANATFTGPINRFLQD